MKKFQEDNSMTRRDRQRATPTEENENLCSQEDNPGNHISPREVEKKNTAVSP